MARIAGVDLPRDKKIKISLTYIYGLGRSLALEILDKAGIDPETRTKDITDDEAQTLRNVISTDYKVEGALRSEHNANVKRLMDIGCYKGYRHRRGLPVNGQRTKTNARTRKGKKRTVGRKSKKVGKKG
ncbi:MAG: 30S ribosomal protein S13 [Candidatus Marinimicrobia bacterium]|nr:30S ribosomal protein S13 [Candidatus Neomarinimicrobiota bacterium]MCF7827496.1 30S ribosomal protein S13 [Candidatus Neomarinimicrobiota bacterium]MCF7882374.1 30S ribosomal protein S13 [Candidatus Neomarinimicrobiota bacterium]